MTAILMMGCASASALTTASCSTSGGKLRCAWLTASRTSAAAVSKSTSGKNSIWVRKLFSSLPERMFLIPDTRATAPSIMLVTCASMVSGDAPGRTPRTDTTGISTSGNSRTSTAKNAANPARAINKFKTRIRTGLRTLREARSFLWISCSTASCCSGVTWVGSRSLVMARPPPIAQRHRSPAGLHAAVECLQ